MRFTKVCYNLELTKKRVALVSVRQRQAFSKETFLPKTRLTTVNNQQQFLVLLATGVSCYPLSPVVFSEILPVGLWGCTDGAASFCKSCRQ